MTLNLKPKTRKNNIVIQNLNNETLIYDLAINKAFCLNETSAMIWQLCDGTKSITEITKLMSNNLQMPVSEDFVWLAISDLRKENLIEIENNQPFFEGKSRREVIRKIGFASMIALPVISSLVAPRAVDAQSGACRTTSQSCTASPQYSQGTCCSGLRCNTTTCSACLGSGSIFATFPFVSLSDCQIGCPNAAGFAINQHNLCCNPSGVGAGVSQSGTTCRCTCR